MVDLRWERWLDELSRAYFIAVFRPELPAPERMRAASVARDCLVRLAEGGESAEHTPVDELGSADTQRRNAAARALSELGGNASVGMLVTAYVEPGRPWLAPQHLVRAARRHPIEPYLAGVTGDLPLRLQPALIQALMAHDRPESRVLLERLVTGSEPVLAEAAVEVVASWPTLSMLWSVPRRVDGTDQHAAALVPAAIAACMYLGAAGDPRAVDWLCERTMDDDPVHAGLAHAALGALGRPECVVELADLLEHADGAALGYALEAAESLSSAALVPALCDVVRRTAEQSGPGLDDNPADHAIRVLERITGRWVSADLSGYDRHGNLDPSTRRRAALLHASVGATLDRDGCYRLGEPLRLDHLLADLLSAAPRRARAAVLQLRARTGHTCGFDCRGDLVDNLDAVAAWQDVVRQGAPPGRFHWHQQEVAVPMFSV